MADCGEILPLVKGLPIGVEIGIKTGESAAAFLASGSFMYFVDPWKDYYGYPENYDYQGDRQRTLDMLGKFDSRQYQLLEMTSEEALPYITSGLDFVFIDGNHRYEYVKQDCENYFPKIRFGGLLTGHDYTVDLPGSHEVKRAVDDFAAEHDLTVTIIGSSWVVRK